MQSARGLLPRGRLLQELGGESPAPQGRGFLLRDLRDRLLDLPTKGGHCLTLIDEAHKASGEVLEAVRLLNNLIWSTGHTSWFRSSCSDRTSSSSGFRHPR